MEDLLELAKQGDAKAQNDLGVMYIKQNTETDAIKATYWFLEAARQGEECAVANLSRCFMEGYGIKRDVAAAINMFAWANLMGVESVDDYVIHNAKLEELISLSDSGNAKAQYYLGLCYLFGSNCNQNVQKAFDLFVQSAGIKGVKRVKKELAVIRNRISEECPFILMKIIPSCQEEGKQADQCVQDFLNGKLFMKTLAQFGDLKYRDKESENSYRGDRLEALSQSFGCGFNPYYFGTDAKGKVIKDGSLGFIDTLTLRKKVFCLAAIEYYQPQNAFNRLCKVNNANYQMEYGRVEYGIDFTSFNQYNEFVKSEFYRYQNEFRISIDFSEGRYSSKVLDRVNDATKLIFGKNIEIDDNPLSLEESIYFDIGDIHEICTVISTATLFENSSLQFDEEHQIMPQIVHSYHPSHDPRPTFCRGVAKKTNEDGSESLAFSDEAYFVAVV